MARDPDEQSGPRCIEVPFFVAPGNREHAWRRLERTCRVTIAFWRKETGVYWPSVYAVLEGCFDLIVGNARHIRNVPGRKTDVKDSEWIAGLVRHGLIARSFAPPRPLGSCASCCAAAASWWSAMRPNATGS